MPTKEFNLITIDVRELPAPEPMTKILTTLASLSSTQFLMVVHNRQPFPLYDKLLAAGWLYHCEQLSENLFNIYIYPHSCAEYISDLITKRQNK